MTWWNETGVQAGRAGCLLAVVMLLAFWGIVIAALTALLGTPRSRPPRAADAAQGPRAARPFQTAAPQGGSTTAPPRRR